MKKSPAIMCVMVEVKFMLMERAHPESGRTAFVRKRIMHGVFTTANRAGCRFCVIGRRARACGLMSFDKREYDRQFSRPIIISTSTY